MDLATVRKLRPVTWQYKADVAILGDEAPWRRGLIAEELVELGLSEYVYYDKQGRPDGILYGELLADVLTTLRDSGILGTSGALEV